MQEPAYNRAVAEEKKSHRVLALDVGNRRIGLAVTDELGVTAQGLRTLVRTSHFVSWSSATTRTGAAISRIRPRVWNVCTGSSTDRLSKCFVAAVAQARPLRLG